MGNPQTRENPKKKKKKAKSIFGTDETVSFFLVLTFLGFA